MARTSTASQLLHVVNAPAAEELLGDPGEFAWIRIQDIVIDKRYQRSIRMTRVREIVAHFNKHLFGTLLLNRRSNGELVAVDGQHRIEAAKEMGMHARRAPSFILDGLSLREEARTFLEINKNRMQPSGADMFRAKLEAGDDDAIAIREIASELKITLLPQNERLGPRDTIAYGTLYRLWMVGHLEMILELLVEAWPHEPGALKALHMRGVERFINVGRSHVDIDFLRGVLASVGPTAIEARAIHYRTTLNSSPSVAFARALHHFYTLKGGKLPSWGDSDDHLSA